MIYEQLTQTSIVKWAFVLGSTATIATQEIPIPSHIFSQNVANFNISSNEPYDNAHLSSTQIHSGFKYSLNLNVVNEPIVIMPKLNKRIKVKINRSISPMKFTSIEDSEGFIV